MKHINQRNMKIISELMNFCYKLGAKDLHIDVSNQENQTTIYLKADIRTINNKTLENAENLLKSPRCHELEEYYWNLPGDDDTDTELTLVGMMIDDSILNFVDGNFLEITLFRSN